MVRCITTVYTVIILGTAAWAGPTELLRNGDFEGGVYDKGFPVGWKVSAGKAALTAEKAHSGNTALEIDDPDASSSVSVESAWVQCEPGRYYVAQAWFRSDDTANASLYLHFFNEAGWHIGTVGRSAVVSKDWELLSVAVTPPPAARHSIVILASNTADKGTFQADDVSLVGWSAEELGGRAGVLPNPGFEMRDPSSGGPAGWHDSVGDVSVTSDVLHGGRSALRLSARPTDQAVPGLRSMSFAAKPGEKWRATGWVKQGKGADGTVSVEFCDLMHNRLANYDSAVRTVGDWTEARAEGIAPERTAFVDVHVSSLTGSEGSVYMDDIALRRVPREGPDVLDIGEQRQLFIDDYLIEDMQSIERVFHPATKHPKPVIVPDKPWEKPEHLGVLGNCVFYDQEERIYKLFYLNYQLLPNKPRTAGIQQHLAYATSKDGLHWVKPKLGIADFNGSKENNLLVDFRLPRFNNEFWTYNNVIKDTRDPDPARRYKALGQVVAYDRTKYGLIVAFSPDGFHWTEPPENPVLPNGDTHTLLGWDDSIGKYVAYPRMPIRSIGYSTSDDFIHWSKSKLVLAPGPEDPPDYQIYGMPVFKYEGLYLGLPWAFIAAGLEPIDVQLAVSRDGVNWKKVAGGQKLIPRGPAGAFDDCMTIAAAPVIVGDEVFFYYSGWGFPHGPMFVEESKWEGSIGLARLRLDGFVSLASPLDSGGSVVTRPVRFNGRRLIVNCNCPKGRLRVELQDIEGNPIPGFTESDSDSIQADSVRKQVTWKGKSDVTALAGTPIRVKFVIADGELYSFGFAR